MHGNDATMNPSDKNNFSVPFYMLYPQQEAELKYA